MSTKKYPLDHIQALHLLTGDEPVTLEDINGELHTRKGWEFIEGDPEFDTYIKRAASCFCSEKFSSRFRIYDQLRLEPVELCEEVRSICNLSNRDLYGLIIAQAVRMAREEREAEKKGEGK